MILRLCLILLLFTASRSLAQTTDTASQQGDSVRTIIADTTLPKKDTIVTKPIPRRSGYVIHGKIVDMNTNEGIPFSIISFPKTQLGATADIDGNFIFKADKLPHDTLCLSALGYKTVCKVLKKNQYDYNFIIELERSTTSLEEVSIKAGEDPAVLLMRAIIARKPFNNPERLTNYKYEAYNRLEADLQRMSKAQFQKIPILKDYSFIYDNLDTTTESKPYLPLYLTETISDYYFSPKPKIQREFIKASMVKGVNNENVIQYLGSLHQDVNVYDNYIPVFSRKFISPISDEGLFYYKYKIKDTQTAYGHKIIMVQFHPKRSGESCFSGDFWVVDSVLAIQRMSMDVAEDVNINWLGKVSIYQEFAPLDSNLWFRSKDKFVANFTFYNSQKFPGMIGRKTTTYHQIVVNSDSVRSVLADGRYKKDVILTDSVRERDDEWWQKNRPDSLTKSEKAINKMVDTINTMPLTTYYKNLINFLSSGVKDVGPIQLGPYFYLYSYNTIEGHRFRITVGTPRLIKNAKLTGYLAYGTRDERFKYGFSGLWILNREPYTYLSGTFAHDVLQRTNVNDALSTGNILSTFFRKQGIPWKLAFADEARLDFYKEYYNGFSHKLMLHYRDFIPYAPLPSAGIFTDKNGIPTNSVTSSEVGVELRYSYKQQYLEGLYKRKPLSTPYPVLSLELTTGLKDILNSGYKYQRARLNITEEVNIPPLGHLYCNVFAGKYFGTLPYALLEIHPGNEFYYYNRAAFQMMNNYEFISDQYAGINIDHNIGGGIFNYIPLIKKLKFRQFWTAKGVIGTLSPENRQLNLGKGYPFRTLDGNPYLELGTGISNIFQVFRIDFVWRVTPKPLPSEQRSKYFGIFGSLKFDF